jgi:hypothetical protein
VSDATSAGRLDNRKVPNPGATIPLKFRRAFDIASGSEIFWTALSEEPVGLELRGAVGALSFSGTKTVERSDG